MQRKYQQGQESLERTKEMLKNKTIIFIKISKYNANEIAEQSRKHKYDNDSSHVMSIYTS